MDFHAASLQILIGKKVNNLKRRLKIIANLMWHVCICHGLLAQVRRLSAFSIEYVVAGASCLVADCVITILSWWANSSTTPHHKAAKLSPISLLKEEKPTGN
jgi:hypothetical protein